MSFVIIMLEKEVEKQFHNNKVKRELKIEILFLYNLLRVSWVARNVGVMWSSLGRDTITLHSSRAGLDTKCHRAANTPPPPPPPQPFSVMPPMTPVWSGW